MADSLLAEETRLLFETQRYVVVSSMIEEGLAAMMYGHIQRRVAAGNIPDAGRPGLDTSLEDFADPLMEHVLRGVQQRVEEFCGLRLYPTYSFFRLYRHGSTLRHHRDRPSCEISVSVNLGPKLATPWPLWITGPRGAQAVELAPGDALLYRGVECEHWRERFDGEELAQVFLHYVDQDGPYSDYRFDERPALGMGPHTKRKRQAVNLETETPTPEAESTNSE
jgi:hypothetical protein